VTGEVIVIFYFSQKRGTSQKNIATWVFGRKLLLTISLSYLDGSPLIFLIIVCQKTFLLLQKQGLPFVVLHCFLARYL